MAQFIFTLTDRRSLHLGGCFLCWLLILMICCCGRAIHSMVSSPSPSLTWSCSISFDSPFSCLWKWLPEERFGRCFSAGVSLVMLTSVDFFTDGGDVLAFFNCLTPVLTPESFCFHLPFYHVVPHIRPFLEVAVNRRIDLLLMACFLFKGFFSAGTSRSMPSSLLMWYLTSDSAWTNLSRSEVKAYESWTK